MKGSAALQWPPRPLVAASILSADFANLGTDARRALRAGADLLHLDVLDGHVVPNLSMGPAICAAMRRACPRTMLDVHLMITDPERYAPKFVEAGANHVTFHIEVAPRPTKLARALRTMGATVGIALNPDTPAAKVIPWLDEFDMVLIMSVHPGFSGQSFIRSVLAKARLIRRCLSPGQLLEVDGGVNAATAGACLRAGCDVLVTASALFGSDDYQAAVSGIRNAAARGQRPLRR